MKPSLVRDIRVENDVIWVGSIRPFELRESISILDFTLHVSDYRESWEDRYTRLVELAHESLQEMCNRLDYKFFFLAKTGVMRDAPLNRYRHFHKSKIGNAVAEWLSEDVVFAKFEAPGEVCFAATCSLSLNDLAAALAWNRSGGQSAVFFGPRSLEFDEEMLKEAINKICEPKKNSFVGEIAFDLAIAYAFSEGLMYIEARGSFDDREYSVVLHFNKHSEPGTSLIHYALEP